MINNELHTDMDLLIVKKIDGTITPREEEVLNAHFTKNHEEEIKLKEYELISNISSEIGVNPKYSKDQRWEKLEVGINEKKRFKLNRRLFIQTVSVAASLFICFFVYFKYEKDMVLAANNGEVIASILPDKSQVILNSGSKLVYKQSLFSGKRKAILEGEAFFKVEKKRKAFIVISDYARIEVLGTKFNVKNRSNGVKVSCQEGSVQVSNTNIEKYKAVLKRGFATVFNDKSNPSKPFEIDSLEINGWTNGVLIFNQTPITEVIDELERSFNVSINRNDLVPEYTYNGEFDNMKVADIIAIIALSLDINLAIIDDENYTSD